MDFGLFDTWNALYAGGTMPWDPKYKNGEMLESEAYTKNFEQVDAVEAHGLGLHLARRRPLFQTGQHGPSGTYVGCGDCCPHQEHQDRFFHPPAFDEARR